MNPITRGLRNARTPSTSLLLANLRAGRLEPVIAYLAQPRDPREQRPADGPLLCAAAAEGNAPIVEQLLIMGVDPDWRNLANRGETALFAAARSGNATVVASLLQHKASPDVAAIDKSTALAHAGSVPVAEALLEAQKTPSQPDLDLLLRRSAAAGNLDLLAFAAANGGNINSTDEQGNCALGDSIVHNRKDTYRALHLLGADLRPAAAQCTNVLLQNAASIRRADAERLIAGGADLAARNEERRTPAMIALAGANNAVLDLLVDPSRGCNIDALDRDGKSVLSQAISRGNRHAVKLFLEAAADPLRPVRGRNQHATTAVEMALSVRDSDSLQEMMKLKGVENHLAQQYLPAVRDRNYMRVKELLELGVSPQNETSKFGDTPIEFAVQQKDLIATQMMLKHISPAGRNRPGFLSRPLRTAVLDGSEAIATELARSGADPFEGNEEYDSAYVVAAKTGQRTVIAELVRQGWDPNKRQFGSQPLESAISSGNREIVATMLRSDSFDSEDGHHFLDHAHRYATSHRAPEMAGLIDGRRDKPSPSRDNGRHGQDGGRQR